jgi:hypothetical protein
MFQKGFILKFESKKNFAEFGLQPSKNLWKHVEKIFQG